MKPFKFGMIVGRFQHAHIGHVSMIEKGLEMCDKVLLMVGSSQESFTVRNPFTCKTRMDILRSAFAKEIEDGQLYIAHIDDMTNENDHCLEWGDYVLNRVQMWRKYFEIEEELDCFIYGNDEERQSWYRPESISKVSQVVLARGTIPISATLMRDFIVSDRQSTWLKYMPIERMKPEDILNLYNELREELLRIPYYKEIADRLTKA